MRFFGLFLLFCALVCSSVSAKSLVIGSKEDTNSIIVGEILVQKARLDGRKAEHRRALGGTQILWQALKRGDIDLYPEFTGTLCEEILRSDDCQLESLRAILAEQGLGVSAPLGFDNSYAFGMRRSEAQRLGITKISDLAFRPELRFGFSDEFYNRQDGWAGLKTLYGLPQTGVLALNHNLAYRALAAGKINLADLYLTDPEIQSGDLLVLEDDRSYFPEYKAVLLYRLADSNQSFWQTLVGLLDQESMRALVARVSLKQESEKSVASSFLSGLGYAGQELEPLRQADLARAIWVATGEHLGLCAISLLLAILFAIPLGLLCVIYRSFGQFVLSAASLVQTIPSLALLALLIPFFGIGFLPAVMALFVYSLLPILRGVVLGLQGLPRDYSELIVALGLPRSVSLWRIELPLASPSILSGIRVAAVINIGTATLGALIGAGGYGQLIISGLRLNDLSFILAGGIPAALMAIVVDRLLHYFESLLVKKIRVAGVGIDSDLGYL